MKALSRRRKSPGRPRKDGPRYPSGDITRSETEREAKSVVLAYRTRIDGLDDEDAKSDLAGHALGLMYLKGILGDLKRHRAHADMLLEAGLRYGDDMRRYYSHYLGSAPTVQAQNLMRVRGSQEDQSEDAAERGRKASNKFMALEGVLLMVGQQAKRTVFLVCVDDERNILNAPEEQLSWLRKGLRALATYYGLDNGK